MISKTRKSGTTQAGRVEIIHPQRARGRWEAEHSEADDFHAVRLWKLSCWVIEVTAERWNGRNLRSNLSEYNQLVESLNHTSQQRKAKLSVVSGRVPALKISRMAYILR